MLLTGQMAVCCVVLRLSIIDDDYGFSLGIFVHSLFLDVPFYEIFHHCSCMFFIVCHRLWLSKAVVFFIFRNFRNLGRHRLHPSRFNWLSLTLFSFLVLQKKPLIFGLLSVCLFVLGQLFGKIREYISTLDRLLLIFPSIYILILVQRRSHFFPLRHICLIR